MSAFKLETIRETWKTVDGVLGSVSHNEAAADHFPLGGRMNQNGKDLWKRDRNGL